MLYFVNAPSPILVLINDSWKGTTNVGRILKKKIKSRVSTSQEKHEQGLPGPHHREMELCEEEVEEGCW